MVDVTRVERRGGRRNGLPRVALCGHEVPYHPGPLRKRCVACVPVKRCRVCGVDCRIRFCSKFCQETAAGLHKRGPILRRSCAMGGCSVEFETFLSRKLYCGIPHLKRQARLDGRQHNPVWDERRRNNHQLRRARLLGSSDGDPVLLDDLIARDGLSCAGCGTAIDLGLAWPHPLSKSLDHIHPVSLGGAHALSNCQLMHLRCNISKGNRVA